jgi:hypothetical protein
MGGIVAAKLKSPLVAGESREDRVRRVGREYDQRRARERAREDDAEPVVIPDAARLARARMGEVSSEYESWHARPQQTAAAARRAAARAQTAAVLATALKGVRRPSGSPSNDRPKPPAIVGAEHPCARIPGNNLGAIPGSIRSRPFDQGSY